MYKNSEQNVRVPRMLAMAPDGTVQRRATMIRVWRWIARCWRRARIRARLRRDLERLDAHMLRDIGCRREDLMREAYRPFWRD